MLPKVLKGVANYYTTRLSGVKVALGRRYSAQFLAIRSRVDTGAQRRRHQLRTETDAQGCAFCGEPRSKQLLFNFDEGIRLALVNTDRPAQHYHEIRF
jgi:hypothetical protein